MKDIVSILRYAKRRLNLTEFIEQLHRVGLWVTGIILALVIIGKGIPIVHAMDIRFAGPAILLIGFTVAIYWWMQRRPNPLHVAIVVDERLALNEKISTALLCRGREDGFAKVAIDDAVRTAQSPQVQERMRRRFTVTPPSQWWISPVLLAAAIAAWLFITPGDLFAGDADKITKEQRQEVLAIQEQLDEKLIEVAEVLGKDADELKQEIEEGNPEDPSEREQLTPEQAKLETFKKFSNMRDQVKEKANSVENQAHSELARKLNQIKSGEKGPVSELSKALAGNNFKAAQEALSKVTAQLKAGSLSDADKKALAELAKQLEQLAANNKALEGNLKAAGIDPNLANNPEALKKAIENSTKLTQAQKQQLTKMAQAMQQANQSCKSMANACQGMSGLPGTGLPSMSQSGAMGSAGQMGNQLSSLEMSAAMCQSTNSQLSSLNSACNSMGQGMGNCSGKGQGLSQNVAMQQFQWMSNSSGQGPGMSGAGQGRGGYGARLPTAATTVDEKANVNTNMGPIIGEQVIDGQIVIKGDPHHTFRQIIKSTTSRARDAIDDNLSPPEYTDGIQHYMGELSAKAEIRAEEAEPETESTTTTEDSSTDSNENN